MPGTGSKLLLALVWSVVLLSPAASQFGTIKIDWTQGNDFAVPTIDLAPNSDRAPNSENPASNSEVPLGEDVRPATDRSKSPGTTTVDSTAADSLSTDSLRRVVVQLGGAAGGEDETLRARAHALLGKVKLKKLRELLLERDRPCGGCVTRRDYVEALLAAVRRHSYSPYPTPTPTLPLLLSYSYSPTPTAAFLLLPSYCYAYFYSCLTPTATPTASPTASPTG
eukprot:scaffold93786_cov57-Phaeocystis_antarctica.AAC.4